MFEPKPRRGWNKWSKEARAHLSRVWPDTPVGEVARQLKELFGMNLTDSAVREYAKRAGFKKSASVVKLTRVKYAKAARESVAAKKKEISNKEIVRTTHGTMILNLGGNVRIHRME